MAALNSKRRAGGRALAASVNSFGGSRPAGGQGAAPSTAAWRRRSIPASIASIGAARRRDFPGVPPAHDDLVPELSVGEGRIGADDRLAVGGGDGAQRIPIAPFGNPARFDRLDAELHARLEAFGGEVEHRLHDRGHAGHHDDVADAKTGRLGDRVFDELRARGDARHSPPRRRQLAGLVALPHHRQNARVFVDRDAEGLGDGVGGDVVVGRPDAAGGEDVGVARAQRVERRDDLGLDVGHDARLAQIDADIGQILRDIADVAVLGPSRQDFVADDQDRRGDDLVVHEPDSS